MTTTIHIQNLKCGGCANTISTKLTALDSVTTTSVNVEDSSVTIEHTTENDLAIITQTLAAIGYPIEGDKNSIVSKAKSFVSCATGKMSN